MSKEQEFNEANRDAIERLMGLHAAEANESIGTTEKFLLKPAPGRVAIKLKDVERETKSGIVLLSDGHAPKPVVGTVVAVCEVYEHDDEEYEPLFRVGDIVVFGKYTGTRLQVDRDYYIILRETDILSVLVPGEGGVVVDRGKLKVNDIAE
jgi:chaperonin GroES